MKEQIVSIWYLIGQILLVYGVLITAAGIYYCFYPAPEGLVLANLHTDLWWGLLMLALGIFYISKFNPKKKGK